MSNDLDDLGYPYSRKRPYIQVLELTAYHPPKPSKTNIDLRISHVSVKVVFQTSMWQGLLYILIN
jgi:hypothetical protein